MRESDASAQRAECLGALVVGGDFQGLGIVRSLAAEGVPTIVLDHEPCIARFSRCTHEFIRCPDVRDERAFLDFLIGMVGAKGLHGWTIFATNDETVRLLSMHRDELDKVLRVPTPPWHTTRHLYDKRLTYELAVSLGIATPRTWIPKNRQELMALACTFPAIIKPAVKDRFYPQTRAKALLAKDEAELLEAYDSARRVIDASEILVQDVIPGGPDNLYSFCALFKEGCVLARLVARRSRQHPMDFGHASTFVETVDVPELEAMSVSILSAIDYYGLAEVEFKRDPRDGQFKFLEVNARTWGWHTIGRRAGVDFPYLLYRDMVGEEIVANGFRTGVKWVRLLTDTPTAARELLGRRMRLTEYVDSLRGEKEHAVFSLRDPLPSVAELLLVPYLWKKRGF